MTIITRCLYVALTMAILVGSGCRPRAHDHVLLLLKTKDNAFFQDIEGGVLSSWTPASRMPHLHVRAGHREGDVDTQRRILQEYYARYVEHQRRPSLRGVLLTPSASGPELVPAIAKLRARRVPVVLLDTRIDDSALRGGGTFYDSFVGSNNRYGGELAAKLLTDRIGAGRRVLVLNGAEGQETASARKDGFHGMLSSVERERGVRYEITERTCNWRRDEARSVVDALISLGREIDGIFAANDEMALGAIEAYRQHADASRPRVIIGFDAIPQAREAVLDGRLTATLAQDPRSMGSTGVALLRQLWAGRRVERNISIAIVPFVAQ